MPGGDTELQIFGDHHFCRVESRIADAVLQNPRLIKLGIKFEFKEVMNR